MDSSRFAFLFQRYTNESCTDDEKKEFMELVAQGGYDVQLQDLMKEMWSSGTNELELLPGKSDDLLQHIFDQDIKVIPVSRKSVGHYWLRIAASFLIFAISIGAVFYYLQEQKGIQSSDSQNTSVLAEHRIIKLPDGSVVKLNAGSTLDYPQTFEGRSSREVYLTGEGYFDVKHDAARAFVVHTNEIKTTVLGTAFNIKAYASEKNITVTVTRGKVRVSNKKSVLGIITRDQQIIFHKESQEASQQLVDSKLSVAWAYNDILFDDITLEDAARMLEERFHVKINLDSEKIKACRFTATFVRGEDLNQILTVICEFNSATLTQNGEGVFEIKGSGC